MHHVMILKKNEGEMEKHLKGVKNVIAVWNKIDLNSNSNDLLAAPFQTVRIFCY